MAAKADPNGRTRVVQSRPSEASTPTTSPRPGGGLLSPTLALSVAALSTSPRSRTPQSRTGTPPPHTQSRHSTSQSPTNSANIATGTGRGGAAAAAAADKSSSSSLPAKSTKEEEEREDRVLTPLALAARAGDVAAIELLLNSGADLALVRCRFFCLSCSLSVVCRTLVGCFVGVGRTVVETDELVDCQTAIGVGVGVVGFSFLFLFCICWLFARAIALVRPRRSGSRSSTLNKQASVVVDWRVVVVFVGSSMHGCRCHESPHTTTNNNNNNNHNNNNMTTSLECP